MGTLNEDKKLEVREGKELFNRLKTHLSEEVSVKKLKFSRFVCEKLPLLVSDSFEIHRLKN